MDLDIHRIGLTTVYQPASRETHAVDIVLVHGLFGHPENTWACKRPKPRINKQDVFHKIFWPRDLLPKIFPTARVMTWGYDVQIEQVLSSTSKASIFQHAETLLSDLTSLRSTALDKVKPIIFIAHSLGGIVVKDALGLSRSEITHLKEILPATTGVVFLGTPHHGSKTASLGKIAFELSKVFLQNPNMQILRALEVNSETLERISKTFGQVLASGQLKVHSFREELDTKGVKIVENFSSTIGHYGETCDTLHANHRDMVKFSSLNDHKLQRVASVLRRWIEMNPKLKVLPLVTAEAKNKHDDRLAFDKEYNACMKSLNAKEARSREDGVEVAYPTTYDWLYEEPVSFSRWLEGKHCNPIYWIYGKPGSGKSTLIKFALNHQQTQYHLRKFQDDDWLIASYFFHDRGTETQKSIKGFLREILYRIACERPDHLESNSAHEPNNAEVIWDSGPLEEALVSVLSKSVSKINLCLFVDALDEHDGNHRSLLSALHCFTQCVGNPNCNLRLCLAGRPENVFKDAFHDCPNFAIHEHTVNDIKTYTKGRFEKEAMVTLHQEEEPELHRLAESIIERAYGVFLWVKLVIDELSEGLCEGDTIEELQDQLSHIPNELEELYTRALPRKRRKSSLAVSKQGYETYVMFQMASDYVKPLTIHHFLRAATYLTNNENLGPELRRVSRDQVERRLNNRSAGLLEASGSDSVVQFIHQTVKDFIFTQGGRKLVREGLEGRYEQTGKMLIFRYIVGILELPNESAFHRPGGKRFAHYNFRIYANAIEMQEKVCIADFFEPKFLALRKSSQLLLLQDFRACDRIHLPSWVEEKFYDNPRISLLYFYAYDPLPLSCRRVVDSLDREASDGFSFEVLQTGFHQYANSSPLLILLQAGISDHLSHSSLERLKSSIQENHLWANLKPRDPLFLCWVELCRLKGFDSQLLFSRDYERECSESEREAFGKVEAASEGEQAAFDGIEQAS